MKILGADWSAFCKALPECYYFDDTDSPDEFADADIIKITSGVICWQGWRGNKQKQDPVFPGVISLVQANNLENNRECISLLHTFNRWKKTLTVQRVTVEVPKDQLDALKAAVKACKGKIL